VMDLSSTAPDEKQQQQQQQQQTEDTSRPTMNAVFYTEYGTPEKLQFSANYPVPVPKDNQLLVKVFAASVNPIDWKMLQGFLKVIEFHKFPFVPLFDISGVVVQARKGSRFRKGDQVFAMAHFTSCGGAAEYIAIDEDYVAFKPENLTHVQAAAVPLAALTSYQALIDTADLKPGQRVLILGGATATGIFAIQIAKALSCHVTATASTRNIEVVRRMGAEVIDYTSQQWGKELAGQGFDVVYDTVGGELVWPTSFAVLKPDGIFVTISGDRQVPFTVPGALSLGFNILSRKVNSWLSINPRYHFITTNSNGEELSRIAHLINVGKISPLIDSTYPLQNLAEALNKSINGRPTGKIVIVVDPSCQNQEK